MQADRRRVGAAVFGFAASSALYYGPRIHNVGCGIGAVVVAVGSLSDNITAAHGWLAQICRARFCPPGICQIFDSNRKGNEKMKKIFDDTMKPYFIRAIYDWCVDKRLSPRLLARADEKTGAPQKLAQEGKIVFNLSPEAVRKLLIDNDGVSFTARFAGGETREIVLAMDDVLAIFDNEEGRGVFFAPPQAEVQDKKEESATPKQESTPPNLQVV